MSRNKVKKFRIIDKKLIKLVNESKVKTNNKTNNISINI